MAGHDARWQTLRDYVDAEITRFHEISNGLTTDNIAAYAVAISVHSAHMRMLAKMRELEITDDSR